MSSTPKISKKLSAAIGLFVSVPLFAMPLAAQTKPTLSVRDRLGIRAGSRLSIVDGSKVISGIRTNTLTDVKTGIRAGIRVPEGSSSKFDPPTKGD